MTKKELLKTLHLNQFIAFDFETTGLNSDTDRIIEIAAIRYVDGEPDDRFVTLINPGIPISGLITDITGISNKMVSSAPKEEDVVDEFMEFLGDSPLVAHNIGFDIKFLKVMRERYNLTPVIHPLYDTLQLARTFLYDLPAFNLGSISEYYGLSAKGSHRAETDTENGGAIFIELVQEAASYPVKVISKMLALMKSDQFYNKPLYTALAMELARTGEIKTGLIPRHSVRPVFENIFVYEGDQSIHDITPSDLFSAEGRLHKSFDEYEERLEQVKYSEFIEANLTGDPSIGCAEAGTGLGKSMAYLFPALKSACSDKTEGPVIISCHTKHLQDQLFYKDLPNLTNALKTGVKAVMLKGRSNYICQTRLNWVLSDLYKQFRPNEVESLLPILIWLEWTRTGDLSECNGFWSNRAIRVASLIKSEQGFCTTNLCAKNKGCFFGRLRKSLFDTSIIIVNHALLLSEIQSQGILPAYENVIIDEAHNLVKTAYGQLTMVMDLTMLTSIIQNIDPEFTPNRRWAKKLEAMGGLFPEFLTLYKTLKDSSKNAGDNARAFFNALIDISQNRYSPNDAYRKKFIIENIGEEYSNVFQELRDLLSSLKSLVTAVEKTAKSLLEKDPAREDFPDIHQVFEQRIEFLIELVKSLDALTSKQNPDWIYWQEGEFPRFGQRRDQLVLSLHGAPVDVSKLLMKHFFSKIGHCILTSATLRTDAGFDYFLRRTGIDKLGDRIIETQVFESPFYYEDQVAYLQYGGSNNLTTNPKQLADIIFSLHKKHGKRLMALFTAHRVLNGVYGELRNKPGGRDLPVFAQVHGTSRHAMMKGMHDTPDGILLGTNTFWEGVDLPGELLEILVITKLPFEVPSEPIVKAYSELLNSLGRNAFMDFSVPECIIKFRQGFGRLIRRSTDEGIFIVLDDRVVTKQYGRYFRDSIPVNPEIFVHTSDLDY